MGIKRWWSDWRLRRKRAKAATHIHGKWPLREFVYLDEVSLRSLLVSQKDTIPEEVSRAISVAEEAELAGKASADIAMVGKAETGTRYQTSNSRTVQTSRKAIVQSWFKEFRDLEDLDYVLAVNTESVKRANSVADIPNSDSAVPSARFKRGALIEIDVTIEVDPVFRLGTLISEMTAMEEEFPEMFSEVGQAGQSMMREAQPINKILQRLLAGLIPIRANAVNYSVVDLDGSDYVVHNDIIADLEVDRRPLEVVGVTEHLGFWKDIRRVLFSSGRFTMLCRVSRDELQKTWTPVKLADLFGEVAPSLVDQINAASRVSLSEMSTSMTVDAQSKVFSRALTIYKDKLLSVADSELSPAAEASLLGTIEEASSGPISPSAQRHAFAEVKRLINMSADKSVVDDEADLQARKEARNQAGLPLFPSLEAGHPTAHQNAPESDDDKNERILDVEVVAIYW